jgi:histidine ammonia-lyase
MTIVLDGHSLTTAQVSAVARDREDVILAAEGRRRNEKARRAIARRLARGDAIYGATTGVGALRDCRIAKAEREQFQWNLLRSHAVSAGPIVAPEVVRAGMVVRANQLGGGGAGVAPELLDRLVAALNRDLVPVIRALGSLGTGDLPALAEIALALLGEGRVWRDGEIVDAVSDAPPVRLGLRDAVGFMSSNAVTAGHAALVTADAEALERSWLAVAALSFEALDADPVVLDERVQAARGAQGQAAVAGQMRQLLQRSSAALGPRAARVQDPFPFRVLPQVDGVCADALRRLGEVLARELNARPENALIEDGEVLSNGNFHAAELTAALDAARLALAQSASLIAARVTTLLDSRMTGLPRFLADHSGLDSGMMMLEYTAHDAAAEVRSHSMPMATQAVSTSLGVESHCSLAATAARRTAAVIGAMRVLVATELVVAVRALQLAGRSPAGAVTSELFEAAKLALPAGLEDRAFGRDLEAAALLLDRWAALEAAPAFA